MNNKYTTQSEIYLDQNLRRIGLLFLLGRKNTFCRVFIMSNKNFIFES